MKKLLCILLLACPLFAQTTHTTASQEGNNVFTGANTFGQIPVFSLGLGAVSASSVSVSGAVTGASITTKNDGGVRYAAAFTGADWCAKVSAADTDLGANTGVIVVGNIGAASIVPSACAAMFTLSANHSLQFIDKGPYLISNTLLLSGSGSPYIKGTGGGPGEASQTLNGTTIQAISGTFPINTPLLKLFDVAHVVLDSLALDCQNITGCTTLLYTSDNSPPSSLNTFTNMTFKGFHHGFVIGVDSTTAANTYATCIGTPSATGCTQADTDKLENFQAYGNCADTTAQFFILNLANGAQNGKISRGNVQCVNVALHGIFSNGIFEYEDISFGSPVGTTPIGVLNDSTLAMSSDMKRVECEGGNWTGGCLIDHTAGTGTAGSPTWIGMSLNGNNATVDGTQQIIDIGSNNSASSTFTVNGSAHVLALGTSKWTQGTGELSSWNLGVLQTNQITTQAANGLQICKAGFATCAKISNDTAGGINLTANGAPSWEMFATTGRFVAPAAASLEFTEGTAVSGGAGRDVCYGNSTDHSLHCLFNNDADIALARKVGAGTATMTTALIATGACGTTVTVAATGTTTADRVAWSFNAAIAANPGVLIVQNWVTAGNVNFAYCNPTAGSVTPSAATINWMVMR